MTLVIPGRQSDSKKRFTISIEEEMFSGGDRPRKIGCGTEPTVTEPNSRSTHERDDSGRKLLAITAGIGVISAVILGYFIGRTRD